MKESDLIPEFIAEKILGWEFIPNYNWPMSDLISDCWIQPANDKNIIPYFYTKESLPTFEELEWTGALLEAIGMYGTYSLKTIPYNSGWVYNFEFTRGGKMYFEYYATDLNYTIARVFSEAMKS